jgi:protein phosphatase
MVIKIPSLSLVLLIGPSGSGKSTFAQKHFRPSEVLNSDACRAMVSDDENDQTVSGEAFSVLQFIAAKRLGLGRLTVVDATNVQLEARKPYAELAKKYYCQLVAIVLNLPGRVCQERNRLRSDRNFGPHVIRNQKSQLRRSLAGLKREGFAHVSVLDTVEEIEQATIERVSLRPDKRAEHGPFDVIGDVHGCRDELEALLGRLGYGEIQLEQADAMWGSRTFTHPDGRKAIFVGDLVDRGPRILDTVRLVRNMEREGSALCLPGNHDAKLVRKLRGRNVQITHGLAQTLAEIDAVPEEIRRPLVPALADFLDGLVSHYVFDDGRLVVAHAGMKEAMQGRGSARVREFALYGETTGESDDFGLPVRHNWASDYRGRAAVVYGHTPVPEAKWVNRTINIDTGCVFGGKLTALRYPEMALVAVPALRTYCEPVRPFIPAEDAASASSAEPSDDQLLDIDDVRGRRIITTRHRGNVTIREENSAAALEVMSRFAVDPRWLIYLPPTMSPCESTSEPELLEHPAEAFAYYRAAAVSRLICEEKHMGSRAIVIACRDLQTANERFGIAADAPGIVYTRTGRRFFSDPGLEHEILDRLCRALSAAGIWSALQTAWVCLDCELLPWSAKAQELLRTQFAAVGAAGSASLPAAVAQLDQGMGRLEGEEKAKLALVQSSFRRRQQDVACYVAAYRRYCWPVASVADLKLAPFHLLATEGKVHTDKSHVWHMETLAGICRTDPELLLATRYVLVELNDAVSEAEGIAWWISLTELGGEGMVVKPMDFLHQSPRGLAQPALKCRGREYLRIIYGPEYIAPENLHRLRNRAVGRKRALALGEFALGIEALERFVRREPLRLVHECVFGVLALESEPVDPRL